MPFIFLGEIPNMPEHGVFIGKKIFCGLCRRISGLLHISCSPPILQMWHPRNYWRSH